MHTTNYTSTLIAVAEDCPAQGPEEPPVGAKAPTIAELQYRLLSEHPYELTSDEVLLRVHAIRRGIPDAELEAARADLFAKPQACLRSSPLAKRYGWGLHHDAESRVALVPLGSDRYRELAADPGTAQTRAMRSKRA